MKTSIAQRAGIVASIAWLIAAPLWIFVSAGDEAADLAVLSPKICEQSRDATPDSWKTPDHCWDNYRHDFDVYVSGRPEAMALGAILPIIFGWLFAFVAVRIGRWIRFGRWKPAPSHQSDVGRNVGLD